MGPDRSRLRTIPTGLFLVLALAACSGQQVAPATNSGTGIPVAPEFATFYESYGGRTLFGQAITDGFIVQEDGNLIQYFQTMRLETDDAGNIFVYPLGEWALGGLNELEPQADETVAAEFQAFYDEHNGEQLFGRALSPLLEEDSLLVQYFGNVRLEWHPALPQGERVQLGHLGQNHFDAEMSFIYHPLQLGRPVTQPDISEVDVFAGVKAPILYAGQEQTLYVTVLTLASRPVDGITVGVQVIESEADSSDNVQIVGETDVRGKMITELDLEGLLPGQQVQLLVLAYNANNTIIGRARVTFKTWW